MRRQRRVSLGRELDSLADVISFGVAPVGFSAGQADVDESMVIPGLLDPGGTVDAFQTLNYPHGHCILTGYMGLRPQDPNTLAYDKLMIKAYGRKRFEEIVGVNIHHVLIYPGLSVQSPLQQLRAVRPLGVDRTLTEIWHFRLKGAPEAIYRRSLAYYNLVNSPATLVNADDLENFCGDLRRGQEPDARTTWSRTSSSKTNRRTAT